MIFGTKNYRATIQVSLIDPRTGLFTGVQNISKFAIARTNRGAKKIVKEAVKMTPHMNFIKIVDCREYKQGLP